MQTSQPKHTPDTSNPIFLWDQFFLPSIEGPTLPIVFLIDTHSHTAYVAQELCIIHSCDIDDVQDEPARCNNPSFTIRIPKTDIIQHLTPFCVCNLCCESHTNTIIRLAERYFPNQKQGASAWERLNFAYQCLPEILGLFAQQLQVDTIILCDQEEIFQGRSAFAGWNKQTLRKKLGVQVVHAGTMLAQPQISS